MTEMVKAKVNGGWDIWLPSHRAARPEWYTDAGWERNRLDSMHYHLGLTDVVYYVGAEEGEMPALCQMWGAEVVLFEPNPKVWPNILAIWQANGLAAPFTFPGFASNVDAQRGASVVHDFPKVAYGEAIGNHGFKELYLEADNYPQIRLDTVVDASLAPPPTALSIDVEGSEWRVLEGATTILERYRPKIWLSGHPEFMFHQWKEYLNDLRGWIKGFGYSEQLLAYEHEVHLFYEAVRA